MAEMKKHIGFLQNSGRKCVVAFMQLPNDPTHALVIDSDALPERTHQAVMSILESNEGQSEKDFANILSRRIMPDTGQDMLSTLHGTGYLMRTPVANVTMLPLPNQPIKLSELIKIMDGNKPAEMVQPPVQPVVDQEKFNQHSVNTQATKDEELYAVARNLLLLAQDIEAEAIKKREEAYRMCPSLRPQQVQQVQQQVAPVVEKKSAPAKAQAKTPSGKRAGRPAKKAVA